MISIGLSFNGSNWNREKDIIGIGMAFLDGAKDSEINNTTALEAFYNYTFSDHFDLSLDAQCIEDDLRNEKDPEGFLVGLRFNAIF